MKKHYSVLLLLWISILLSSCSTLSHEKMKGGKYEPTWESLSQYGEAPKWFRDVKFGIWAHWGPQCQPEAGDWYARHMYEEDSWQYKYHLEKYGHPSEFGFKDVINTWKAEKWDPEKLMKLFKDAGAQYFFALGNHHDNFDLWDSKYQKWNSVNMGPKRDIIYEWEKAARNNGMYFGVSIHSSHAWTWMETAQGSDKKGAKAGVFYDGKLTKKDGKGKWWEGYDPQDLYAQNHALSIESENTGEDHNQWDWENGASIPSEEYCQNFFDRTVDMVNKYNPDLVYYDDTSAPLWPISNQGLRTIAHIYNKSIYDNNGANKAVVFGKILTEDQKQALVWDVEKGVPDQIQEKPWQTCTCIGNWHYDRSIYENDRYKSAKTVLHMLTDIISKNGNLLLSIPIRGDGSIDDKEKTILEDIAAWMSINQEAVFGTRPWLIFGEGPVAEISNPLNAQGFNEGKHQPYTSEDIRFVTKNDILYAHVLAWPENNKVLIKSISNEGPLYPNEIRKVELLGYKNPIKFVQTKEGLLIEIPNTYRPNDISFVLKIY